MEQTEKDFIQKIYHTHYMEIMEFGEDYSEEILISLLAQKHTKITFRCIFDATCDCKKTVEVVAKFNEGLKFINEM